MHEKIPSPNKQDTLAGTSQNREPIKINQEALRYFSGTADSIDYLAAKKIFEKNIVTGKFDAELINTPETIEALKIFIQGQKNHPRSTVEGILGELKASGMLAQPVKEKKNKVIEEDLYSGRVSLELVEAQLDESAQELLAANLLLREIEKANIFRNKAALYELYERTAYLENNQDTHEFPYYAEFAKSGFLRNGEEEAQKDFTELQEVKKLFAQHGSHITTHDREKIEDTKKIATLTERGLAFGVSQVGWYGEQVKMIPTSEFDDVKRGVDGVLEIIKEDTESDFIGLGIDVTFRGLQSEEFKSKFFRMLDSLTHGHQTRIKYGTDHTGAPMKEFAVPKILIHFDIGDVKDIVHMLQQADSPTLQKDFVNSPQKFMVMKQIVHQCLMLSGFAEEVKNPIFRRYNAIISSLKELSWKSPLISDMLESIEYDEVSDRLNQLISEFKNMNR
ncbi:hypothetical protein H6776_02660 [Candidatus Nomurabacteria bacterium]|nr:hypothetical protein [Candidatus Nomurabacteria bacterium]